MVGSRVFGVDVVSGRVFSGVWGFLGSVYIVLCGGFGFLGLGLF